MPFHAPNIPFFKRRPSARYFLVWTAGILSWVPVGIVINTNLFTFASITGPSMYPYLNSDYNRSTRKDHVLVNLWQPWKNLERGQLIAFRAPHDPERVAVKRIIALEGDEVQTKAPYPKAKEIVPSGYVWVEGDMQDRHKTMDSNTYGPVSKSLITGQLRAIVWPWSQMAWLNPKDYTRTSRVREATQPLEKAQIHV